MLEQVKEWHQLSNRYWLKITYKHTDRPYPAWTMDIVVAKTKRKCNDARNKPIKSPKSLLCKSSNYHQNTIEALMASLKSVLHFEKNLPKNSYIMIQGTDEQRVRVYSRLKRYGYEEANWYDPGADWHKGTYYYKLIR